MTKQTYIARKTLLAIAVASAVSGLTACGGSSSSSPSNTGGSGNTGSGAPAVLNLTNDNIYTLAAGFPGTYIGNGEAAGATADSVDNVTVNVEPGTLILGSAQEAMIVTRGSEINIKGTAADPVVMGSRKWFNNWVAGTAYADGDYDGTNDIGESGIGEWAGLALMGFAQSNQGTDVIAEGNVGNYGGTDDTDSSGSISYLVIRGAGNDIDGNGNELNGLTMFGTGSGTKVDHVQVHRGLDDGIEHFGSTDFMSYIVLSDNKDDGFDWGQGYRGGAQFALIKQSAGATADRMIEADNDKANPEATPVSRPVLANFSMISAATNNKDGKPSQGAKIRRGTGVNMFNSVIAQDRAKECIEIDGDATFTEVAQGTSGSVTGQTSNGLVKNVVLNCNTKDGTTDLDAAGTIFTKADIDTWFDIDANNVRGNTDYGFTTAASVTAVPAAATIDLQDTNYSLTTAMGGTLAGNFVETDYIGAFPQDSSNNWTQGWTVNVNGNFTVWEPATGGTLAGATPTGDGSCPTGTAFVETVDLPNGGGQMDVCQLQRRYDSGDF